MMKALRINLLKSSVIGLLLLTMVAPVFANDECAPAVDAADAMNVNQKECDYSNEGLNGFLQRALKKDGEATKPDKNAVSETQSKEGAVIAPDKHPQVATKPSVLTKAQDSIARQFMLDVEVDQWANVALARAQLLPKAMERCGKTFSVVRESYRSLPMGRIELRLRIECDE
jgi:hypothetical protein